MKNYKIIIQARMGSKRLPGKMLLKLNDKPLLLFLIDRLLKEHSKESIIVATSNEIADDEINFICNHNDINCFRGSEKNVYSRFREISKLNRDTENFIRLTGDNPLINLNLIRDVYKTHQKNNSFFTSTRTIKNKVIERYSPKGQSVDVIRRSAFQYVNDSKLSEFELEHVIPVFYKTVKYYIHKPKNSNELISISIDDPTDFEKLKNLKISE